MKKRLRIVHILFSFSTGGMEKGIAMLVNATCHKYEHIILCLSESGRSEKLLPDGIQIISLNKTDGNSLKFIFRLAKLLKSLAPDVVHTRNWAGLDGVIAARLAGIKGVVHGEHGWGVVDPYGLNIKRVWIRRVLSLLCREFTCVSKQMKNWLKADIKVRKPITPIYNGIDLDKYAPGKARSDSSCTSVCMVGRLDPIKDHATLFRAIEESRKHNPELQLYVIGDGPEKERLERMAGQGVSFLGNRGDVNELLKKMDIFVLTSINEGISNTILEAMATSLPVIATNVGGNPELIDDGINGHLFNVGDWKRLSELILAYCQNSVIAREHGAASCEIVKQRFIIEKMAHDYSIVWERVARL